ncbi:MAG: Bax inhibitor-1/YccA family protein [Armatimonadetes bacterium]|nr:Bax inhibitor-1/YccA family protein [Armatimonadota bacterium]
MNEYNVYSSRPEQSGAMAAALGGRLPFVQKVYALFMLGILTTIGAGAMLFAGPSEAVTVGERTIHVPLALAAVANAYIGVLIAFIVSFFIARAVWRVAGLNVLMMLVFCAITGLMITPRVFIATIADGPGTVAMAGAMTAITFGTLTLYAFISRRNFSFLGAGLNMALWGLIIGGLLNGLFFHSPFTHYLMAWFGVVIFGGYVLYDTSVILRELDEQDYTGGALRLYLDAVNLFLTILSLLSGRRD